VKKWLSRALIVVLLLVVAVLSQQVIKTTAAISGNAFSGSWAAGNCVQAGSTFGFVTTTSLPCYTTAYLPQADTNNTSDCLSATTESGCTTIGTTPTGFNKHLTFNASTVSTFDGTHQALRVTYFFDYWSSASPPGWVYKVQACPSANYSSGICSSGKTQLMASPTEGTATTNKSAQGFATEWIDLIATSTPGTFLASTTAGGAVASNLSTVTVCGSTCTSGSWVMYMEMTIAAATVGNYIDQTGILPLTIN